MLSASGPAALHSGAAQPAYVVATAAVLVLAAVLPWTVPAAGMASTRRRFAWVGAMAGLAVALLPPLEHLSERSLAAHMGQHVLLLFLVSPLLVLADPVTAGVRALPGSMRTRPGRLLATARRVAREPVVIVGVALVHAAVVLGWHVPVAYTAAVERPLVHVAEHAQFLLAGVTFWWLVRQAARRRHARELAAAWVGLAGVMLSGILLGLFMTFSSTTWYPGYEGVPDWGLSGLEDQQLAGAVMWATGGPAYLAAALLLLSGAVRTPHRAADLEDARRPVRPAR